MMSTMKKAFVLLSAFLVLFFYSCGANDSKSTITEEMAYEGVSNYCHSAYDWSVAKAQSFHDVY